MHPTIEYEITWAGIADRRRQADRIAIAQAASRAARRRTAQGRYPAVGLARRILTVLDARRLGVPARCRPLAACQPPACCSTCA
jgi:hypothetical protein